MGKNDLQELRAMLTVIWEKLDNMERANSGRPNSRVAGKLAYFNELKSEANKIQSMLPED